MARIRKFQERNLGEQNTKASLIEPILEALGWDIRDPDEVHREFKPTSRDGPVAYALLLFRKPRLFAEAKGLGENLVDRKWISQVLLYATVAGVEWCVLTDGDEYSFYKPTAAVDAEKKLFCRIKLSENPSDETGKALGLIENLLDVLWNAYFVDWRVKQVLQEMLASPDKGLVRLIRRKLSQLNPKDIVESLRRPDFRINSPTPFPIRRKGMPRPSRRKQKRVEGKPQRGGKVWGALQLCDEIRFYRHIWRQC